MSAFKSLSVRGLLQRQSTSEWPFVTFAEVVDNSNNNSNNRKRKEESCVKASEELLREKLPAQRSFFSILAFISITLFSNDNFNSDSTLVKVARHLNWATIFVVASLLSKIEPTVNQAEIYYVMINCADCWYTTWKIFSRFDFLLCYLSFKNNTSLLENHKVLINFGDDEKENDLKIRDFSLGK